VSAVLTRLPDEAHYHSFFGLLLRGTAREIHKALKDLGTADVAFKAFAEFFKKNLKVPDSVGNTVRPLRPSGLFLEVHYGKSQVDQRRGYSFPRTF
jgi:hypothetical protein